MREMAGIRERHENEDQHFLFEENAKEVQLVVYNQGDEPIRDASLSLILPNHNAFYVANFLPKIPRDGKYVDRRPDEQSEYPTVNLKDDMVQVSHNLGDIPNGELIQAFEMPLRVCVGTDLSGRRLGMRYSLFGQNLRSPVKGKLRLLGIAQIAEHEHRQFFRFKCQRLFHRRENVSHHGLFTFRAELHR